MTGTTGRPHSEGRASVVRSSLPSMRTPSRALLLIAPLIATLLTALLTATATTPSSASSTGATDLAAASPVAARSSTYTPAPGPYFSRPGNRTIHDLVLRNIRETPSGSYIRGVAWTLSSQEIADALIAAHRRGVVVRVLVSRRGRDYPATNSLQAALDSRCGSGSCFRIVQFSARGSDEFDGKKTTLHQKSWLFSTTGTEQRVSIITSHNPTDSAKDNQYNDAYQFVGNLAVYNQIRDTFVAQSKDRDLGTPYRAVRISSTVALYFGPWNSPSMADPVVARINALPTNNLVIRVANSAWQDQRGVAIARALARKKEQGAGVFVLASQPLGPAVRDVLVAADIPIRDAHFSDTNYHHMKFMTAKWTEGGKVRTRVWAGSENWSDAARGSDELVFRVGAGRTHGAYVNFFDSLYN